jgi:hypothetical protein
MMPDVDAVTISIQGDPGMSGRSTTYYSETLTLTQFGTVSGSAVLPDDAPPVITGLMSRLGVKSSKPCILMWQPIGSRILT